MLPAVPLDVHELWPPAAQREEAVDLDDQVLVQHR